MAACSAQQKDALAKFKRLIADVVQPSQNDDYLLKWLKARNYDCQKAELMFRESLHWRKKVKADDILMWNRPEVLEKYYPREIVGHDLDGCPVWLLNYGKMDIKGLVQSVGLEDMLRQSILILEQSRREMAAQTNKLGRTISRHITIIDMQGFCLRDYLYKPSLKYLCEAAKLTDDNYPEILKKCFVINAPKAFAVVYNLMQPFMSERTKAKVEVFNSDRSKWLPALLNLIHHDQLPNHLTRMRGEGGTGVTTLGSISCSSQGKAGEKQPAKSNCTNQKKNVSFEIPFTSVVIAKGEHFSLKYDVTVANSYLKWAFKTESHDIGFVVRRNSGNAFDDVAPYRKVDSHVSLMEGKTDLLECGEYTLTFDNSYSLMRSKCVSFRVELITP